MCIFHFAQKNVLTVIFYQLRRQVKCRRDICGHSAWKLQGL